METPTPTKNTFGTPLWITMLAIWLLMLAAIVTLGLGLVIWNLIGAF